MGCTLSSGTIAGILGGCKAGSVGDTFEPRTLTGKRNELVATMAELIIPTTDTPGARAAGVHIFIDSMLTDWYGGEEREHFLSGLREVDNKARARFDKPFLKLQEEEQVALLTDMEEEAYVITASASNGQEPFFVTMKTLTIFGYYTSEIGATQELRVMPMGEYRSDVPFEEIGRTWA